MFGFLSGFRFPKLEFREPQTEDEQTIYLLFPTLVFTFSALLAAAAGMLFILIGSSNVYTLIAIFSAAVLCLIPAFPIKAAASFAGYSDRALLTLVTAAGLIAGLIPAAAYYVSHDYEISVYRYMKVTSADDYYYGGYSSLEEDYASPEEFVQSMRATPASRILGSMELDKLAALSVEQVDMINSQSLWDYFGFSEILGTESDEIEDSLAASRTMNAYEFTFEYRGLFPKNFSYMLKHPRLTFEEIGIMVRAGSHSVTPAAMLIFVTGQLIAVYMICMHFGVNDEVQIIFYKRPAPVSSLTRFFKSLVSALKEMKSGWKIRDT